MRALTMALAAVLITSTVVEAQPAKWEAGTRLGITRIWTERGGDTGLRLPGGGIYGQPTLHATYFIPSGEGENPPVTFIEAEVLLRTGFSGGGGSWLQLGAQAGYLSKGTEVGSPYAAANLALLSIEGGDSLPPGLALGYRQPVTASFAFRAQANYRRWLEQKSNEFSAVVIVSLVGR